MIRVGDKTVLEKVRGVELLMVGDVATGSVREVWKAWK